MTPPNSRLVLICFRNRECSSRPWRILVAIAFCFSSVVCHCSNPSTHTTPLASTGAVNPVQRGVKTSGAGYAIDGALPAFREAKATMRFRSQY